MWLLVVAAGSGYLARCLQSKRPRLNEQGSSSSRSGSPQDGTDHTLCEEALQVKERFEKLNELPDEKGLKRSSCCGSGSDVTEGCLMPLTPFQRGDHDVNSLSKLACKSRGWPSAWPSRVQAGERNNNILPANESQPGGFATHELRQEIQEISSLMESDDDMASFQEKHGISSGLMEEGARDSGSSVRVNVSDLREANVTVITPLGDVSWRASREDAERLSLGDLPNILDWTSMAASQKHLLFGPEVEEFNTSNRGRRSFEGKKKSRGGRSRSKDPSGLSTPIVSSAPTLPALPSALRKRKAAPSILHGYGDPDSLAKEVLLFGMGLHVGACCMLFYHKSQMEKFYQLRKQPSLNGIVVGRGNLQLDDDDESTASVVTEETKPDQMAMLEAELEAELEIMQMNIEADNTLQPLNISCKVENTLSPLGTQDWTLCPRELDRRLRIVLQERQAKEIEQLQAELQEAEKKLHMKEEELRSWKDRVYSLTQSSLPSPTDENALVEAVNCDSPVLQRPVSRRKWFPDDNDASAKENGSSRSQNTIHTSLPSLVSAMSSCNIAEKDNGSYSGLTEAMGRLSLGGRQHAGLTKSCVTVSDLLQGVRQNGEGRYTQTGASERRSSLGTTSGSTHVQTQVHEEHLVYSGPLVSRDSSRSKSASNCQHSQVIRTVETNYRVEERHFHGSRCQDSHEGEEKWMSRKMTRPRHSTGNLLAGRQRCQRQRRRWFT